MKKILTLLSVLAVIALFAGCSLVPVTVDNETQQPAVTDLFNFDGLDYVEGEVLVKVVNDVQLNALTKNAIVLKEWSNLGWVLVSVPAGETTISYIEKLRRESGIFLAQPNLRYEIDPIAGETINGIMGDNEINATSPAARYSSQWGFENINAEAAWDITTGDSNVIVAIVDTGVQVDHPEFSDKVFIDAYDTTTQLSGENNMHDLNGHGTHVAGIAADNGSTGKIAGVAWDCPILPVRVEDDQGSIFTTYLIEAMTYLGDYAADHPEYRIVANMSIGGRGYNFAFKDAIDYAFDNGILLVTSAGNDSKRIISYPSAYNGVVSVAASTPYDIRADFSTQGWWNSVAAPGVEILSTYITDDYTNLQGTSMASPFVTGAAALLLSKDSNLTPLEVKNQIEMTARGEGFNEQLGYGILDIEALLGALQPMQYSSLNVTTNIISDDVYLGYGVISVFNSNGKLIGFGTTGESGNYLFNAIKPDDYTVTLSYYDEYTNDYFVDTDTVTVVADQEAVVNFTAPIPVDVIKTSVYSEDISNPEGYRQIPITIAQEGSYEFVTSFYNENCDTEMYLYDDDDNLIAYNDDYQEMYSRILMNLQSGDYVVYIQDFSSSGIPNDPLNCHFEIYSVEVSY